MRQQNGYHSICWLTGCLLFSFSVAFAAPDDPYMNSDETWSQPYPDQWAVEEQRVYADVAPQQRGEPVIVAVIDTGIDYTHEDLASEQLWWNPREERNGRDDDKNGYVDDLLGWNFVEDNNNPWDQSGHGTHIAGVIAACTDNGVGIAAVNPDAKIMSLKVANFAGQARSSNVAAAIYYAVDNGAQIINLSLGGELITELEKAAATYAEENDVLIIVSSGNRGIPAERFGYAGLPGVLAVGASTTEGVRAGFSNFGNLVHLLAPGVDILSLRAEDTDFVEMSEPLDYEPEKAVVGEHYYRANGTSFSAAIATGVASRIKSLRPELGGKGLKSVLLQSAADIEPAGIDQLSGYGSIDFVRGLGHQPGQQVIARLEEADLSLKNDSLFVELIGVAEGQGFEKGVVLARPVASTVTIEMIERATDAELVAQGKKPKKRRAKKSKKQIALDAEMLTAAYQWQELVQVAQPVRSDLLATISFDDLVTRFYGSTDWEVKLEVAAGGGSETALMTLSLPVPDLASTPEETQQ